METKIIRKKEKFCSYSRMRNYTNTECWFQNGKDPKHLRNTLKVTKINIIKRKSIYILQLESYIILSEQIFKLMFL